MGTWGQSAHSREEGAHATTRTARTHSRAGGRAQGSVCLECGLHVDRQAGPADRRTMVNAHSPDSGSSIR